MNDRATLKLVGELMDDDSVNLSTPYIWHMQYNVQNMPIQYDTGNQSSN